MKKNENSFFRKRGINGINFRDVRGFNEGGIKIFATFKVEFLNLGDTF